ncbi:MAG: Teichuronic acid biosynthesis protein TuaB [Firmicutes bacterium ADurb.Bin182]|nr:MAG: Teichuronic acid biosynthesis protein TuaB [Firmicutes bacterium ADurb.Bin182]
MSSTDNIKSKAVSGILYRFAERIAAQTVSTLVSIVLARILLPEEYGIVALVTIIITLCDTFVVSGLGASLIQKQDADRKDFSTIFWAGLLLSSILFVMLFFMAPVIASWYENDTITPIIRVMAIRIPIASVNSVQQAYVSKKLMFKKFFWATISGTVISGVTGIIMAYQGFGVWALVAQYLINVSVGTIMLFLVVDWHPTFEFSFKKFTSLLSFGWKILVSGLLTDIYDELRSFVIAGKYSTEDLSFYTRGKQFPQLISKNVSSTITSVMFPVFSQYQEDKIALKRMMRNSISLNSYIMAPLLIGLAAIAHNFVAVVYTDTWLPAVPFVQVFCILYLFKPLKNINKSCLKAMGYSGLDLILNLVEKVIGIILIFIFMNHGPLYLAISALATYFISAIIDAFVNGKILSYSIFEQINDLMPSLILSAISCGISYLIGFLDANIYLLLLLQIVAAIVIYIRLSAILKIRSYKYLLDIVKKLIIKK